MPDEILVKILEALRLLTPHDPTNQRFLQNVNVCRKWIEIGREIVYQTLCVVTLGTKSYPFLKTWNNTCETSGTLDFSQLLEVPMRYQSLRILNIHFNGDSLILPSSLSRTGLCLACFPSALSQLSVLHTFSLCWGPAFDFSIPPAWVQLPDDTTLVDIIRNVPLSVRDIFLNTAGLQQVGFEHENEEGGEEGREEDPHICEALSALVPRLHHLSLCVKNLCPSLFASLTRRDGRYSPQPTSTLRSLNISLNTVKALSYQFDYHTTEICGCFKDWDYTPNPVEVTSASIYSNAFDPLAQSVRRLFAANAFPKIKHLKVLDGCPRILARFNKEEYPTHRVFDAIQDTTSMLPRLGHGYTGPANNAKLRKRTAILRLGDGTDVVGYDNVISYIPGEGVQWFISKSDHTLFPGCERHCIVKANPDERLQDSLRGLFCVVSGEEFRLSNPGALTYHNIWEREEAAGRKLLRATVRKGIPQLEHLHEEKPGKDDNGEGSVLGDVEMQESRAGEESGGGSDARLDIG